MKRLYSFLSSEHVLMFTEYERPLRPCRKAIAGLSGSIIGRHHSVIALPNPRSHEAAPGETPTTRLQTKHAVHSASRCFGDVQEAHGAGGVGDSAVVGEKASGRVALGTEVSRSLRNFAHRPSDST